MNRHPVQPLRAELHRDAVVARAWVLRRRGLVLALRHRVGERGHAGKEGVAGIVGAGGQVGLAGGWRAFTGGAPREVVLGCARDSQLVGDRVGARAGVVVVCLAW